MNSLLKYINNEVGAASFNHITNESSAMSLTATKFRNMNGLVGAFYYGEWAHSGPSYNMQPWRYLKRFQDRVPITAVPMSTAWKLSFKQYLYGTVTNGTFSKVQDGMRITGSTADPYWTSPSLTTVTEDNMSLMLSSGKVTSSTSTVITDSTKVYAVNSLVNRKLRWLTGANAGLEFNISSNTATTITVGTMPVVPSANDDFAICSYYNDYQLKGSQHQAVRFRIKNLNPTCPNWEGKIYFTTTLDATWDATKSVQAQILNWNDQFLDLIFDTSGNSTWMNSTIKQIRMDLYNSAAMDIVLQEFEVITTDYQLREEENRTLGGPSDQQWFVDWEIQEAYRNGVDFFIHNQYWGKAATGIYNSNICDYNFQLHVNSTAELKMKYCMQWSHHDNVSPFSNLQEWLDLIDYWYTQFSTSRYLRINNKPVLYIFSLDRLINSTNHWGQDLYPGKVGIDAGKAMLDEIQNRVKSKVNSTCPDGVHIVGMQGMDHPYWNGSVDARRSAFEQLGTSSVSAYNYFSAYTGQVKTSSGGTVTGVYPSTQENLISYSVLKEAYKRATTWAVRESGTSLPYFPNITAGWDKRPWVTYSAIGMDYGSNFKRSYNCIPAPSEFKEHCTEMVELLLEQSYKLQVQNIPPIVSIYAWNEFGEGGYICPTRGARYSLTSVVKDVFGSNR